VVPQVVVPEVVSEVVVPEVVPQVVVPEVVSEVVVPEFVFILPYRDREEDKARYLSAMEVALANVSKDKYEMWFSHQMDVRPFNRGAMKNLGFLAIKEKYPNDYRSITFVFNDVDTFPVNGRTFDYKTKRGVIKHFYGFAYALGGIFSITGEDFERINGFPNFWSWGYEDNLIQKRAIEARMLIDRSEFVKIEIDGNNDVSQIRTTSIREISVNDYSRYVKKTGEGISSISKYNYSFDPENKMIHFTSFDTGIPSGSIKKYDLRNGNQPYKRGSFYGMRMHFT
jgi:hypothetical protein